MRRATQILVLAAMTAAAFLPAATAVAAEVTARGEDTAAAENALIAAVNRERARAGLATLAPEARLACAARAHARDLARSGRFDHVGSDGGDLVARLARAGYPYAMAAENLALAGAAAETIVGLWRDSPGHNRNMREPDARAAGVARLRTTDGRYLWVLVVAAERQGTPGSSRLKKECKTIGG